jgi:hypothetical protein
MINMTSTTGARAKRKGSRQNGDEDRKTELQDNDILAEMAHSSHVCVQANFVLKLSPQHKT